MHKCTSHTRFRFQIGLVHGLTISEGKLDKGAGQNQSPKNTGRLTLGIRWLERISWRHIFCVRRQQLLINFN